MENEQGNTVPAVAWENQVFNPPTDGDGESLPFLRETLVPASEVLAGNKERMATGFYRLEYIVPIGYSISDAEKFADDIKEHFAPGQTIGGVTLEESFVGQGDDSNPPRYMIPIQIDYRTHEFQPT